jgi:hypothetical protein
MEGGFFDLGNEPRVPWESGSCLVTLTTFRRALIFCFIFVFLKHNISLSSVLWSLQVNLRRDDNTWCSVAGCFTCSCLQHFCIHRHALCTRRQFPRLLHSVSQDAILRCNFPIRHNSVPASHNSESFSFVYCCEVFHIRSGFSCGSAFACARGCVRACSIRWSAMAFCYLLLVNFVTFTYWELQNGVSVCVCMYVCICVC